MNKQWYVLHVMSGKETEVQKRLTKKGYESAVPVENRMIRSGGKWIEKPYVVFPGYVFVHISYSFLVYYEISKINGVIKLLGDSNCPQPLTKQEAVLIVCNAKLYSKPPEIRFSGNRYEIISEPFKAFKVKHIDRHARRITFMTTLSGREKEFTLSFKKLNENTG